VKASRSAGILMYRLTQRGAEVLLVHPGGPFWRRKDLGAWSIPKGEPQGAEHAEETARREFAEELGTVLEGPLTPLGQIKQRAGKIVEAFAAAWWRSNGRVAAVRCSVFPKSTVRPGFRCRRRDCASCLLKVIFLSVSKRECSMKRRARI
jgi:predicted NUDIX family NTP pyrophosphohydrolase